MKSSNFGTLDIRGNNLSELLILGNTEFFLCLTIFIFHIV